MLPKAVLSFVGRLVGIAAVLASPMVARAAESSAPPSNPTRSEGAHRSVSSQPAAHSHGKAAKKATKRSAAHARREAHAPPASPSEVPAVITERASSKNPPKPSLTPLPTVAAVTAAPLAQPIDTKTGDAKSDAKTSCPAELRDHGVEPRRTPIVRASTRPEHKKHAKPPCLHTPVDVMRGTEEQTFPLTKCDGSAAPLAVEEMSVLVRPGSAARPSSPIADLASKSAKEKSDELAPGIKKIDERVVERMQLVLDHFARPGKTPKVFVVSGYRPSSKGSFHAMGRAIDFRVEGIENTDLVTFCKTLPDTGCGFYPNSSFIHLDVRDSGTGHVSWIDASGPGEKPEYVASWPLAPKNDDDDIDPIKLLAKLDEMQILPPPNHEIGHEMGHDVGDDRDESDAPKSAKKEAPATAATIVRERDLK